MVNKFLVGILILFILNSKAFAQVSKSFNEEPPYEALAACVSKLQGKPCRFTKVEDQTVVILDGTCMSTPDKRFLTCNPNFSQNLNRY